MHITRNGSGSNKSDKSNSKDGGGAASPLPDSAPMETSWQDSYDPLPKSKGKSVKLKKTSKTENTKKLIRQGSKDSVVLVGYKNLKAPFSDPSVKYKEGEAPLNAEEEQDDMQGESSACLRTNVSSFSHPGAHGGVESVADDDVTSAPGQKGLFSPQAGTGAVSSCSRPCPKDEQVDLCRRKQPHSSGLKQIEVKPSIKDPHQGGKVTVLVPCRTDGALSSHSELPQTNLSGQSVSERPGREAAQLSQVSVQVKSDCIRLPDGAPSASSRLSDSGIESEPSSVANQCAPGLQTCASVGAGEAAGSHQERPPLNPASLPGQPSSTLKPSGAGSSLYPESASASRGVQSSLTSINSLPSDDDGESSSRGSSTGDVFVRKSNILAQEQCVVFSGDLNKRPASDLAQSPDSAPADSQLVKSATDLQKDAKMPGVFEGASGHGALKESSSEAQAACASSNSATSSTDLVKRGMVENYFGSCSSTDVSEISPVETSAITLGVQTGPPVEEDEDEAEHEMIENGYYEEGDGYAFVNGVGDEEPAGDAAAQDTSLLLEHLGIGYIPETKDSPGAPVCWNPGSSGAGCTSGRPACPSASLSARLQWYECAAAPQIKA